MPAKSVDLAWLAGVIEGEGYLCIHYRRNSNVPRLAISVRMSDEDVIRRVAKLFDVGVQFKRRASKTNKAIWCAEVYSDKAISWAMTIYSFMGVRRRSRIKEMIEHWKSYHYSKTSIGRLRYASQK